MMAITGRGSPAITWLCPPLIGYYSGDEGLVSSAKEASGMIGLVYSSLSALVISWPLKITRDFGLSEIASDFSYCKHCLWVQSDPAGNWFIHNF